MKSKTMHHSKSGRSAKGLSSKGGKSKASSSKSKKGGSSKSGSRKRKSRSDLDDYDSAEELPKPKRPMTAYNFFFQVRRCMHC